MDECGIFAVKRLHFLNFLDFNGTWTLHLKYILDCGWTCTEFEKSGLVLGCKIWQSLHLWCSCTLSAFRVSTGEDQTSEVAGVTFFSLPLRSCSKIFESQSGVKRNFWLAKLLTSRHVGLRMHRVIFYISIRSENLWLGISDSCLVKCVGLGWEKEK